MDEQELKARELELRERQLAFERERFLTEQDAKAKPKGGLARAFSAGALAALVPVVGVFLDIQEADRQSFETRLANLTDGYAFYFELRKYLKEQGDASDVEAVVRTMSTAFPEAFCGVRPDLHRIALAKGDSAEQNAELVSSILALDELTEQQEAASSGVAAMMPWRRHGERTIRCEPIALEQDAPIAPAETAPPEPQAATAEAAPSLALRSLEASAPPPPTASRHYTIYVQVGANRGRDVLASDRPALADHGFHLAAGVERMKFRIRRPQVRYYRADQATDAEALAAWLSQRFAGEGLTFEAVELRRPGLPDGILELWIPEAAGAAAPAPAAESAPLDLEALGRRLPDRP